MTASYPHRNGMSLRFTLVGVVTVAVLAAVVILSVNSVSYLRRNLFASAKTSAALASQIALDQALTAEGVDDFTVDYQSAPADPPRISLMLQPGTSSAVATDDKNIGEYRDEDDLYGALSDTQIDQLAAIPTLGSRPVPVEVTGLGEFLVTSQPLDDWGTLFVGYSLEPTNEIIDDFVRQEILYALIIGLLVTGVGAVVVLSALRPLRRVTQVANHRTRPGCQSREQVRGGPTVGGVQPHAGQCGGFIASPTTSGSLDETVRCGGKPRAAQSTGGDSRVCRLRLGHRGVVGRGGWCPGANLHRVDSPGHPG